MRAQIIRVLLFLSCCCLHANDSPFYFTTLNLKDGLSQLSVLNIFQDSRGFMWFGTRNGLNKYDGTSITVYKHTNYETNSLLHNHITSIVEDKKGFLWVATINGLNRLDLRTDSILSYDKLYFPYSGTLSNVRINDLVIDGNDHLWVATNVGLYIYNTDKNSFNLVYPEERNDRKYIETVILDSKGNIVFGTMHDGLCIYDQEKRFVSQYKKDETKSSLTDNHIYTIYEDKEGILWAGTKQTGLNAIDREKGIVTQYTTQNSAIGNDYIRCINWYEGKLLLGTWDGISILDPKTNSFCRFTDYDDRKGGLNHFSVYSIYVDNANTLWAGTYSGGVSYSNPLNNRFRFHDPKTGSNVFFGIFGSMAYQNNHTLWIASEGGGLLSLDLKTNEFNNYLLDESHSKVLNDNNIFKSVMVEGNIVWCGTQKGTIYQFDTRTKKFTLFYSYHKDVSIYAITRSQDGTLWVGTTDTNGLNRFSKSNALLPLFMPADSTVVTIPSVRTFLEIRENVFLAGTHQQGLYLLNLNTGRVENYSPQLDGAHQLYNEHVTSITKDAYGQIWIGTFGGGICLFDEEDGIKAYYTMKEGLPDDNICSIIYGDNGKLWISTGNGISCFDPVNKIFVNYTDRNEIGTNEFSIIGGIKLPGNNIYFSGSEGIVSFRPDQIIKNTFIPPVVLTSLTVNNISVKPNDLSGILQANIHDTPHIILKPDQNNFSVSYASLNYLFPHQNQYAYKLEGYDKDWNYVGNRKEAFYTNLKPGDYVFHVKASNNDHVWNNEGTSVSVHIKTPLWQTWYAYLFYLLTFACIAYTLYYYLLMKRKLERDLKEKQKEQLRQEEFHQSKINMFTNFSHELRTPLMLIISPLEEILQRVDIGNNLKGTLQMVHNNTQRLLLLVNQLLDLRKNQTGNLQLRVSNENLYLFMQEIYIAFNQIADNNRITFNLLSDSTQLDAWFDRSLMEKVVFNLLSNAFKHTGPRDSVTIIIKTYSQEQLDENFEKERIINLTEAASDYIYISVEDTGKGIPDIEKRYIFSPFYQGSTEEGENVSGTGIGLSLVLSIIKLHKGIIWVEDNKPKGSVFKLLIPNDFCVYTHDQLITEKMTPVQVQDTPPDIKAENIHLKQRYLVLLAEDNHEVRNYIKQHLEPCFDVLEAENGVKAFEIITESLPDLVISDIMMPEMDGLQLCSMIKQDIRTGHIPVIIITAKSMVMHIKEGFRCGADDYIVKPFNMDVLLYRICNILISRERLKELYGKKFSLESLGIETSSADDRFMQKFFEIVEANIQNPDLNVDLLCKEIGMGRASFYRKLKAITDISPIDLIRNKRLEIAAQMLLHTDMNVTEVSMHVGFNSNAYFSTCFKSVYGMAPTEYIQRQKEETLNL